MCSPFSLDDIVDSTRCDLDQNGGANRLTPPPPHIDFYIVPYVLQAAHGQTPQQVGLLVGGSVEFRTLALVVCESGRVALLRVLASSPGAFSNEASFLAPSRELHPLFLTKPLGSTRSPQISDVHFLTNEKDEDFLRHEKPSGWAQTKRQLLTSCVF